MSLLYFLFYGLDPKPWKINKKAAVDFVVLRLCVSSQHQIHTTVWEENNVEKWHSLNNEMCFLPWHPGHGNARQGEEEQTGYQETLFAEERLEIACHLGWK